MSRLIVKNLPKNIKEERINQIFGEMGQITDLNLKYTKRGVFRRFAFVGYKTQTEAQRALKHFHNTFIDTSKIHVDICKDFGDDTAPRPWSKYSEKSSAFQKRAERLESRKRTLDGNGEEGKLGASVKKKSKKHKNEVLDELENDSGFQEFLEVHKNRSSKHTWSNDEQLGHLKKGEEPEVKKKKVSFKDSNEDSSEDTMVSEDEVVNEKSEMDTDEHQSGSKEAKNITLSDMDYLKKKINSKDELNENKTVNEDENKKTKKTKKKLALDKTTSSEIETNQLNSNDDPSGLTENFERKSEFTIKLRGLPFHAKKKDITEFLSPLKIIDIRMTKDDKNRPSGRAYIDLESKEALKDALKRHKDYMKGRYIEVFEDKRKVESDKHQADIDPPWMKNAVELAENKDLAISETGRLYLRNLSYTCTEEELSEVFCKFGPTTEVFLPIDKHSNQSMGFAFITFMMPEHAVMAFNKLDGHVFQGRLLHILPAKPKKNDDTGEVIEEESSYKKQHQAKVASLKSKDHTWNTLFLGVNAVAEIMADKYNSSKSDVLDVRSKSGLALRMALGETQVVAETKEFLTNHGVKLDAFGHPDAKRSKTVIIVKNLQHGTNVDDLEKLFSPFGHLGRVILPPSGVTALVEFFKLSSASKAFEKIAYTKFKNVPLYLEWAPADVLDQSSKENEAQTEKKEAPEDSKNENNSESDSEPHGHVVFVKNLNFDTNEDSLEQLFSDFGKVSNATIAKKKDAKNKGSFLSMGYGFVEFKTKKEALNAVKELQNFALDGHNLQLKMSNKNQPQETVKRKSSSAKQKSSKILVRNVPFEATQKELRELFGTFGELKTVRLPKKLSGTGPHRGFAFIDFLTKQDAKRAFKSLCTSTHLYGRRLVLEWAEDNESVEELRKKTADYFHEPKKKTKTKDFGEDFDD